MEPRRKDVACRLNSGFPVQRYAILLFCVLPAFHPSSVVPTEPDGNANRGIAASCPNIVVIVCDDMGFSDIGCYGGEIEHPI